MRGLRRWIVFLGILVVIGGAFWLWWRLDLRGNPRTLSRDQPAIAHLLESAAWVGPKTNGRPAYLIVYGGCPSCAAAEAAFTAAAAKGADPRFLAIARPDLNGQARSTPDERADVAELWLNRDYGFWRKWSASGGSLPGAPPADGDSARTAVIDAGRATADQLAGLLKQNGAKFGYPLAVWWNKAGAMRTSVLDNGPALRKARKEIEGG